MYVDVKEYHEAHDNVSTKYACSSLIQVKQSFIYNRHHAQLIAKFTGCKASYALMDLPHHDRINQTVPDAMHTIKDCVEKLVYLITG